MTNIAPNIGLLIGGGKSMCCETGYMRNYLTKEEKIEMLKEYKDSLEKETKGVSERIRDLEKAN